GPCWTLRRSDAILLLFQGTATVKDGPRRQGRAGCQAVDVRTASDTASASRVAATSCTRTTAAPLRAATAAAATLPKRRSGGGRPVAFPMNDLRDAPTMSGRP